MHYLPNTIPHPYYQHSFLHKQESNNYYNIFQEMGLISLPAAVPREIYMTGELILEN